MKIPMLMNLVNYFKKRLRYNILIKNNCSHFYFNKMMWLNKAYYRNFLSQKAIKTVN